jgi:hypothetical protein
MSITSLSPQQLRAAADLKERLDALQNEFNELLGGEASAAAAVAAEPARPGPKRFSARTRAKMAAAQRARWEARRGDVKTEATPAPEPPAKPKQKRRLSAQGLANIRAGVAKRMARKTGPKVGMARQRAKRPNRTRSQVMEARLKALAKARAARWAKYRAAKKAKDDVPF